MKGHWIIFGAFIGIAWSVFGQNIPRDTSYTLESTLKKVKKYHPEANASAVYSNPSEKIHVEKDVIYKELPGRSLPADLFYPKLTGTTVYPGLVLVHGGGWRAGNKALMTPLAEAIAAEGYVVMALEYRLSLEASYPAAVIDLLDAINWMRQEGSAYGLDPTTIAIAGCSAGGQLAALVGTTAHKDIFESQLEAFRLSAIIDMDGVLAFHHPESEEGEVAAQWLGGSYDEANANWEEASALNHVDDTTPPILFLASAYPRFLAGKDEVIEKLNQAGTYTEIRCFEGAPHSFWLLNPWFEPTVNYITDFLDKVVKNR